MQQTSEPDFLKIIGQFVEMRVLRAVEAATTPLLQRIDHLEGVVRSYEALPQALSRAQETIDGYTKLHDELFDRVNIIEARAPVDGKDGIDGKDGEKGADGKDGTSITPDDVLPAVLLMVQSEVQKFIPKDGKDGAPGKDGVDGKDVDMDKVNETVLYAVERNVEAAAIQLKKFVEELPKPKDGIDGKDGAPGKDAAPIDVAVVANLACRDIGEMLNKHFDLDPGESIIPQIAKHIASLVHIEKGEKGDQGERGTDGADGKDGLDGKSVTIDDVSDLLTGLVDKAVAAIEPARGVAGLLIDRDGQLITTYTDGATQKVGVIVGKDGADGKDGAPGKDGVNGADGAPGANGKDGMGFEQLEIKYDGERNWTLAYVLTGGEIVERSFHVPAIIDRGLWKEGSYQHGDAVTFGGSMWIAQRDTDAQPETLNSGWRLAVKRGREGKQGLQGYKGADGKDGRDGRDLTQMGPDGSKWG